MTKNFEETTAKIRDNLLDEFDRLKDLKEKDSLTESDLDYYLARDRKAMIVLKTLQMDLQNEAAQLKHGKTKKQIAQ